MNQLSDKVLVKCGFAELLTLAVHTCFGCHLARGNTGFQDYLIVETVVMLITRRDLLLAFLGGSDDYGLLWRRHAGFERTYGALRPAGPGLR